MDKRHSRVEIGYVNGDTIWLRYFGGSERESCRLWKMPVHRAMDLTLWWRTECGDVKTGHTSIRDKRVGDVLISTFAPTLIHVRGVDKPGTCPY